jgi:hypothetical protein
MRLCSLDQPAVRVPGGSGRLSDPCLSADAISDARNSAAERAAIRKRENPVAGFCAQYANEPPENCCAQLTERTRSREYKSSDQRDHERKQHKVTQEHGHTYALFFRSHSCPQRNCRRLDSRLWNSNVRADRSRSVPCLICALGTEPSASARR